MLKRQQTLGQGEILLQINPEVEPLRLEEARLAHADIVQLTPEGKKQLADVREQIRQLQLPMADFIDSELHDAVDIEVRRYRKQKDYNQRKGKFSGRIDENIDLPAMNTWLDETAPAHYQHVEARHALLYADHALFLPRHDSGTWFVNYDDAAHRLWLDELAKSCLTAQCLYSQGAEQYADYVRSADKGALRQLFYSWSPTLEAALNTETRLGEVLAALSDENMSNTRAGLFGSLIGSLSFGAAATEFASLQKQLESPYNSVDPWIKTRKHIVIGQMIAYAIQAIAGFGYTSAALTGVMSASAATAGYLAVMARLGWVIAILGGLYLMVWFFQKTPLPIFLYHCCWSKQRARDLSTIALASQRQEMQQLLTLLYSPRISFTKKIENPDSDKIFYLQDQHAIETLSIDLPGATPNNVRLDVSLMGDPIDHEAWRLRRSQPGLHTPPRWMRDMGAHWLNNSHCEWIPSEEGQGLRISGKFEPVTVKLASLPQTLSLRVKYSSPLTSLLQINQFIGGEHGLAFTITANGGVIALRDTEAPSLNQATEHRLGDQQCSRFLQPKVKK